MYDVIAIASVQQTPPFLSRIETQPTAAHADRKMTEHLEENVLKSLAMEILNSKIYNSFSTTFFPMAPAIIRRVKELI